MKKAIVFTLSLLALGLKAQLQIKKNPFPNTQATQGDYLYLASTEVSNLQYREFIEFLNRNNRSQEAKTNYPDTNVWQKESPFISVFTNYYFTHPAYNDYPVVGITQKQALAYCQWLEQMLYVKLKSKSKYAHLKFKVRLPTPSEWRHAALGGLPSHSKYSWPGNSFLVAKGRKKDKLQWQANVKSTIIPTSNADYYTTITTPAMSYWPNGYKLYNMLGNVAEWTTQPDVALGGSWNYDSTYSNLKHPGILLKTSSATSYIGFRYLIEIEEIAHTTPVIQKLSASKIEKQMAPINSNLYACKYETSNEWYNTFLKSTGLYQYASADSNWLQHSAYAYKLMYSKYHATANFPVVNISYQAALAYCQWLSNFYNVQAKRKYKKVKFTLPTAQEWSAAAAADSHSMFPWKGSFARNSKGAYLANFFPVKPAGTTSADSSQSRLADNLEYFGEVKSYFPNPFGLFNCAGNASEMLLQSNECMGGSWNSVLHELKVYVPSLPQAPDSKIIPNISNYEQANCELGFRVFMHVIEE